MKDEGEMKGFYNWIGEMKSCVGEEALEKSEEGL